MWPLQMYVAVELAGERARQAREAARRDALARGVAPDRAFAPDPLVRRSVRLAIARAARGIAGSASAVACRASLLAARLDEPPVRTA